MILKIVFIICKISFIIFKSPKALESFSNKKWKSLSMKRFISTPYQGINIKILHYLLQNTRSDHVSLLSLRRFLFFLRLLAHVISTYLFSPFTLFTLFLRHFRVLQICCIQLLITIYYFTSAKIHFD